MNLVGMAPESSALQHVRAEQTYANNTKSLSGMQKQKLIVQATEQSKNRFHPGSNFLNIMQVNDCVWSGALRWLFLYGSKQETTDCSSTM